jgi:thiamine biosynthesis protein ThiI
LRVISLLSGGIDSAVSTALALDNGAEVISVHMLNYPFANNDSTEKIKKLMQLLAKRFDKKLRLHIVPYSKVQIAIAKNTERKFACVLCRRMMLRIAERVAQNEHAEMLLTGESLGQVASQTLQNLATEHSAVHLPIAQPLLGMDKLEIERIAKNYGTFEISILPGSCCNLAPSKPSTQSRLEKIEFEECKLDIEEIIESAMKEMKTYDFAP